jgi:hypothetical protein
VYPRDFFPHFIGGYHVLYTRDTVSTFYKMARDAGVKYLTDMWFDDVLFNGIFAEIVREMEKNEKKLYF